MALAESWHIRSRARSCTLTERPFEDGETIMTALFPDPESSGYVRKDFSVEAWKGRDQTAIGTPFSFWKAVYNAPVVGEKQDAFKRESPEDLLRRLVEEEEDHTENARYILAVMLERKKVLRETDTQRTPTGILRVYEHRKLGDVFIVKDPNIALADVEKVQEEVMVLLDQSSNRGAAEPEEEQAAMPPQEEAVAGEEAAETVAAEEAPAGENDAVPSPEAEGEEAAETLEGAEEQISEDSEEDATAEEREEEAGEQEEAPVKAREEDEKES